MPYSLNPAAQNNNLQNFDKVSENTYKNKNTYTNVYTKVHWTELS